MTQIFRLGILEREVRRIKQKHFDILQDILSQTFKSQSPPPLTQYCPDFVATQSTHFDYLLELFTLGCYLSRPCYTGRIEKVYARAIHPSMTRRAIILVKQLAAMDMDVFESYCLTHKKDVNQTFVPIREQAQRHDRLLKYDRDIPAKQVAAVCYALSLSGTDYFLGHILVSPDRPVPDKDIKVAVMTKESLNHTPRISAVVLCTLKPVPNCQRFYRQFLILDTHNQGLYDFTIVINRVARNLGDVKGLLVQDPTLRYVITLAP